jgi:hypothetical protein
MNKPDSIIGLRVKIEYDDQNEDFASLLPRYGIIVRQINAQHKVNDWFLVKLNAPFDYSIKSQGSFFPTTIHCEDILIRSRWKGYRIGKSKPTSVFIVLITDKTLLNKEPINIESFYHVAWGRCHTIQT